MAWSLKSPESEPWALALWTSVSVRSRFLSSLLPVREPVLMAGEGGGILLVPAARRMKSVKSKC